VYRNRGSGRAPGGGVLQHVEGGKRVKKGGEKETVLTQL